MANDILSDEDVGIVDRPPVKLPDGSVATVRSIGVGDDQGEWVIPTIVNGKPVSNDDAISLWKQGKNNPLGGPFKTQQEANDFAQQFHQNEAKRVAVLSDEDVGLPSKPTTEQEWLAQNEPQSYAGATSASTVQSAIKGGAGILKGAAAVAETMPLTGVSFYNPPVWARPESDPTAQQQLRRQALLGKPEQLMEAIRADPLWQAGKDVEKTATELFPVEPARQKQLGPKIGAVAGGFVPMVASGPAAPATIGLQALGDGLENNYDEQIAQGKSTKEAAESAINRSIASGAAQSALFAFLPAPLRKAGDKLLIDRFAKGVLSRFLYGRIAQAGEGAVLGATSRAAENMIQGRPVTEGVAEGGAGLAVVQALMPRGPTQAEQDFLGPPSTPPPQGYVGAPIPETRIVADEYVPPEPGPLGVVTPEGRVVSRGRLRVNLPAKPLTTGAQNAIETGQVPQNNQQQYPGTAQRGNVPPNAPEVRQGPGEQTGGGDSTVGVPEGQTTVAQAQDVAKEIGYNFKQASAFDPSTIPDTDPEKKAALLKLQNDTGWEFTDPKSGISFYTRIGATPDEIRAGAQRKADEKKTFEPPPAKETATTPSLLKFPAAEVPAGQIAARPDLMQFKDIQDETTGENEAEKLTGKWDESKAGMLMLWEPKDPKAYGLTGDQKYIVANGHHRFAFGSRENVPAYLAQIFKESDGYTAKIVRALAAEANIADGKGTIYDRVKYLRNTDTARSADEKMGLRESVGRRGEQAANIAFNSGDDLYAAFVAGKVTPEQAEAIAKASPSNASAQRVGISAALRGTSYRELPGIIGQALQVTGGQSQEMDLFGDNDSAMKQMQENEAKAEVIRQDIRDKIRSVQAAARNPEAAKKLGVNVKDPKGVLKRIDTLKADLERWEKWWNYPDLQKQITGKEVETKPASPAKQEEQVAKALESGPKTANQIAEELDIINHNVRRILGKGAKSGKFVRLARGVYGMKNKNGSHIYVDSSDSLQAIPELAKRGVKVDFVFLDPPYKTAALVGGNRGIKDYQFITPDQFSSLIGSIKTMLRSDDSPVYYMYSQAPSGLKEMQRYTDAFAKNGFTMIANGKWRKTFKDGSPVTNPRGELAAPEGIALFSPSGKFKGELPGSLDFEMERPPVAGKKGRQSQKPGELYSQLLGFTTKVVPESEKPFFYTLDPFAGTGGLAEASAKEGVSNISYEIDEKAVNDFIVPKVEAAALDRPGPEPEGAVLSIPEPDYGEEPTFGIKPGFYDEDQMLSLIEDNRSNPPAVRYIAEMLEVGNAELDTFANALKRVADKNSPLEIQKIVDEYRGLEPERPDLTLSAPESIEEQNAREASEKKAADEKAAAEKQKAELAQKATARLGGDLGSAGQGGLFEEPGEGELFKPKAAELKTPAVFSEGQTSAKEAGEPKEVTLTESQKQTISEVQRYRIKDGRNSPQTYTVIERIPQTEVEKNAGDPQAVKVKNDKTGEITTVYENQLQPVKTRTPEERAASKPLSNKELDDRIRKEGADPKDFPTKASKREYLRRLGKLNKRDIAEGIAEKLESKKLKGKPGELYVALFPGLDPATLRTVWNGAISVAQAAIRAGGTVADGIDRAIQYIRENVRSAWDEAAVRREIETSIGPVDREERHQVAGVEKLGSEYEPETIRAIQSRLRVGYFDGTEPVEPARTEQAWNIANQLVDPARRGAFSQDVQNNAGGEMAPGLLVKELWDYAVRMATRRDDSLLRFIVNRYADFETTAGGGSTAKAARVLRSARELSSNPLWGALVTLEREAAAAAGRRLAVGPELFNDIISRINDIRLTPEEVDNVLRTGTDERGRTIQQILDEMSPERAAARDVVESYSPAVKDTALETVYEFLKQNTITDENAFKDQLTERLLGLGNPDIDEATARQIAEQTWGRKNTVETTRRRAAWDRVLKELDERSQRTAEAIADRLEKSQTEWQKTPERRNEALKVIKEALDPKTPLPAQNPALFKNPLRDRLMELGVNRELATRLADDIYFRRIDQWASARRTAMERASQSGSTKSLIEAIQSSPYRAQKDPAWRQKTAEDWFMSNGLSRDQAVTAARLFSEGYERAMQDAAEKLARKLLTGKPPRNIADIIKAIRAGLTDPSRNWVEDIAALNGWKSLTPEQHAQLAEIDSKLADPSLSLPEQSELFDQMNSIVQRAGDGSKRWKYAVGEFFAANKLSGLKTLTLHLFQPITATFVRDFPTAAAFQTRDLPTIARAYVEAAKNFFPELKYAWQKDIYYLSQSKMISYHNELRNQFEDGLKSLKSGDYKGALKLTYAWAQYFLRALQSANQANQAIIREWKLTLYGSQAMRDAGMSTQEISHIVDAVYAMKQAAYEEGLARGMSKNAAYVRADDLTFQQMRTYFSQKIPSDLHSIADDIIRSAENDQYSTVGRLSPENTGKEEGWASAFVNKLILRPASELRKEGGFKSVAGMTVFGFVSIPIRVARYLSNFSPYGFVRYGRYKYGQSRGLENPWNQSYATELQAQQRLREAVIGTAVGALGLAMFHTTADPDREKRKFGIYISGAWKGITSKVERDALDKIGFKPLSLHVVVDGKVRSSIPMTRTGHALGFLFGLSAIADDIAWKEKMAAATGKEVPIGADVLASIGTLYNIVGQQGFLQSVSHFQNVASGSTGGAAIEKSIADALSSAAGGFIPGQVFLTQMSEAINGPLDKSSIESDVAANFPVIGAHWQQKAINRLGDALYDQTWYGKSLRLGAPIAFKVAQNQPNNDIYTMMVDKGVAPPDLRRYIIEEKYGPLSDDQWSKFAKKSGDLLKQSILENIKDLKGQDPKDLKQFLNKAGTEANNEAADSLGLESVKETAKTASSASVGGSAALSLLTGRGATARPAALQGMPRGVSRGRLRLPRARGTGTRRLGKVRIAKLRLGSRKLSSRRLKVAKAKTPRTGKIRLARRKRYYA